MITGKHGTSWHALDDAAETTADDDGGDEERTENRWNTDDVDELYEGQVEADVDDVSQVSDGSNERVVAVEQMVNETNFVVATETLYVNTAEQTSHCTALASSNIRALLWPHKVPPVVEGLAVK